MKQIKLRPFYQNDKAGFKDQDGNIVIDFIYDEVHPFSVGLALVRKNGKWGYINTSGKLVIPCKYNPAWSFTKNGLAAVCQNGKCGFINQKGKVIIPLMYDDAKYFGKDGTARVKLNGEIFYIDGDGNKI